MTAPWTEYVLRSHQDGGSPPPWTRRRGTPGRRPARVRPPAALDHRPGRVAAADGVRRRPLHADLQRRDLQLPASCGEALDYPYRTSGDTEVLLATSRATGLDCARASFVGQFAFACTTGTTERTWLVRDRLGVLPLYYYVDGQQLVFGSEIKALLPALGDRAGVDETQLRRLPPAAGRARPDTLFARRPQAAARAHVLDVSRAVARLTVEPYWSAARPGDACDRSPRARRSTWSSTRSRQASTPRSSPTCRSAPTFSGGVDSSLIVALADAARARSRRRPVETFSAGFGDPRFDELPHAGGSATSSAPTTTRSRSRPDDFKDLWAQLTWHRDAPVSEPADIAVPSSPAPRAQHVKVVLSGEGSDELFAGYPKYRYAGVTTMADRLPSRLRGSGSGASQRGAAGERGRRSGSPSGRWRRSRRHAWSDWFAPFTDYEATRCSAPDQPRPPTGGGRTGTPST